MSTPVIATFNVGSSSLKFSLYTLDDSSHFGACHLKGALRDLSGAQTVELSDATKGDSLESTLEGKSEPADLIGAIASWMATHDDTLTLTGVGHRVVHGGTLYGGPTIVRDDILARLEAFSDFAPAHQPHNLAGVQAVEKALPEVRQTLSFDTAFHRTMPRIAELYALPRELSDEGLLRFGFHGLSYAHIAETIGDLLGSQPKRLLALHLGSGASACAILDGKSVASTMGLTAVDGLPMATRCGDLDPGVVLHLIQDRGMGVREVADMLYNQSGLLGVSGLSSDTRVLLRSDAPEAEEAIDLYCYRIAREAGSLAVAMGGLDAVAFSGGVGENAPEIRSRILRHLKWLGVVIDPEANRLNAEMLSTKETGIPVMRIVADEERIIARECASLL